MRIRAECEHNDSKALQNVGACRGELDTSTVKVFRSLRGATSPMVGFDVNFAAAQSRQTEDAVSVQAFQGFTGTGGVIVQ